MHHLLLLAVLAAPKNIILFVGDGMGPAHFTAARYLRADAFRIGTMPVTGLVTTQCADRAVTDSAAAASALATGEKANYEVVSADAEGKARPTVLEVAEKAGKATGLVTTAEFADATPAAFASHAKSRREIPSIITQMLQSGAEVIAGSGDASQLGVQAKEAGYSLVTTRAALDAVKAPHVLAVFPKQVRDVDNPDAPLPVLTRWAIDQLRGDKEGFFLVVEHEGTDSSSHQNNNEDLRKSLQSLDEAVGVALDFAAGRNDTLILVTGDHETGGLRITQTTTTFRWRMEWSTTDHTATMVPVFAYGPGSSAFSGVMDNTDIGKKLLALVK